ncbi:MAG: pyruvate, phosphate dikinase [Armatimonadetes bacterium]|nr:pyruvate, phosphate dikinase [Armatimonadota bacterium]
MTNNKRVYLFREGNARMRDLLGGKGANLAEMTNIGLPVPPGFTITTDTCNEYTKLERLPDGLWEEVLAALADVEKDMGKKLGDPNNPLLVSVRSGAKFSMPGMMDTVLNLGLNDDTLRGIVSATGNERFAYDAYRRFIMMFSDIVLSGDHPKLKKENFEHIFDALKQEKGARVDTDVDAEGLKDLARRFKAYFREVTGEDFPTDPMDQLKLAIIAVFKSWNNERAIIYRNREKIPHDLGTAVNVQTMVYGNMGDDSGSGVLFTRNPATGDSDLYGDFLKNAQGEDVVAGVRTPENIDEFRTDFPEVYDQLAEVANRLERHYRDMQDIEFTIEKGRLFVLQCRSGKRTAVAAVKIAVDMVNEALISKEDALMRLAPETLEQLLHPRIKSAEGVSPITKGLNAGPGGASGKVALDSRTAIRMAEAGEDVILVRKETNPDDLGGMLASKGVLTSLGGRTSHAALIARQYGIPTVCGAGSVKIDEAARQFSADGVVIREGEIITIDGTLGLVYNIKLETEPAGVSGDFGTFMQWADDVRRLGVRANADTPEHAADAVKLGGEGIGLTRTEHMFLGSERAPLVADMILAEDEATRDTALAKLLPLQRQDFVGIFKAMEGRPVTIRLIDPPLHEFLPPLTELIEEVTRVRTRLQTGCWEDPEDPEYKGLRAQLAEKEPLLRKVQDMHEMNPMLGLRGCRLSIYFPGIVKMQVAAIIGAACEVKKSGMDVHPEIMIPLIGTVEELTYLKEQLIPIAEKTMEEEGVRVDYLIGTMIEIPRAALTADEIAKEAQFFSFGTNDLTQMGYGISRDDAGKFLPLYVEKGIFKTDPTDTIDQKGIGRMMKICVDDAKAVSPGIKLGICGEHGGEPESVKFCHRIGLNYVSCSPKRIPVARLAAAQAVIEEKGAAERDK